MVKFGTSWSVVFTGIVCGAGLAGCATGGDEPSARTFVQPQGLVQGEQASWVQRPEPQQQQAFLKQTAAFVKPVLGKGVAPCEWPIEEDGRGVISYFGERGVHGKWHNGMDIKGPMMAPVISAADGVVKFSGTKSGYGEIVIVEHGGGWESYYAHLSARLVDVGAQVSHGTEIGKLGQTGNAQGPHVHYEVHLNGEPVDPIIYLPN